MKAHIMTNPSAKRDKKLKVKPSGFTLIEVMLVMVLIGVIVSAVTFNPFNNRPEDQLEAASARFTGIFTIAAEYGLLNNVELGLVIEKDSYQFLAYDGDKWQVIKEQDIFSPESLPEGIELKLELDDLPIAEEDRLDDDSSFFEQEEDDYRDEEKEKPLIPQIFLLSGGDITSFKLIFSFNKSFDLEREVEYQVIGLFTLPLNTIGPLYDGEQIDSEQYQSRFAEQAYEG